MAQEFNLPSKDDPDFNSKVVSLLEQLFKGNDNPVKSFTPIEDPEDVNQYGDVWFDSETNKLKVYTPDGIKTLQYEP